MQASSLANAPDNYELNQNPTPKSKFSAKQLTTKLDPDLTVKFVARKSGAVKNVDQLSAEQVLIELKEKRLPTFGTVNERKERLRKNYGLEAANEPQLQN